MSQKFNYAKIYVDWYDIDYGMTMYVARTRETSVPVGFVWGWGIRTGKMKDKKGPRVFDVAGSYVASWHRRMGVRKKINEQILEHYQYVRSACGTREGAAFMKASGYTYSPAAGWVVGRRKRRA